MKPEKQDNIDAASRQIEIYRKMSGAERLHIGFELYELARKIITASVRQMFSNASEEEIHKKIKERMMGGTG